MTTNAYSIVKKAEASRDFAIAVTKNSAPAHQEAFAAANDVVLVAVGVGRVDVRGYTNAFKVKDVLKAAGFFWSSYYKTWFGDAEAFAKLSVH